MVEFRNLFESYESKRRNIWGINSKIAPIGQGLLLAGLFFVFVPSIRADVPFLVGTVLVGTLMASISFR